MHDVIQDGITDNLSGTDAFVVFEISVRLKKHPFVLSLQSTLVISNSKGLSEILRHIRTSTYQIRRI